MYHPLDAEECTPPPRFPCQAKFLRKFLWPSRGQLADDRRSLAARRFGRRAVHAEVPNVEVQLVPFHLAERVFTDGKRGRRLKLIDARRNLLAFEGNGISQLAGLPETDAALHFFHDARVLARL